MEIKEETSIEDIINECPSSLKIFEKYKIQVFICGEPVWENLGQVLEKTNLNKEEIIEELRKAC